MVIIINFVLCSIINVHTGYSQTIFYLLSFASLSVVRWVPADSVLLKLTIAGIMYWLVKNSLSMISPIELLSLLALSTVAAWLLSLSVGQE